MDIFKIDKDTCNKDGICSAVCPAGLIELQEGNFPKPVPDAEEICIRCGHCVAVCPTGSFSHREMNMSDFQQFNKKLHLTPAHCEHFLRSRRSIRVYREKQVPRDEILKLIEIARFAPSGHNSQCVQWIVIDNRDELKRLGSIVIDWMRWMITEMPEIALSLHMERTVARWEKGNDVILRNAPAVIITFAEKENRFAMPACTIALSYLELASTSMGLGCCWAGYFNSAATTFPPMIKELSLPEDHISYGAMMLGYPRFTYLRLPPRNPPAVKWR